MTEPHRRTLARWLSICGIASRTRAAQLIAEGRVTVNGRDVVDPDRWIDTARDRVCVDDAPVIGRPPRRVVLLNKPRGAVVSEHDPDGRTTVLELLPLALRGIPGLHPVGRLDRASAGLLLLTNDSDLAARLLDKHRAIPKRYRVKLRPAPAPEDVDRLRAGIDIGDDAPTRPASIAEVRRGARSSVLEIALVEGRNRQIRRMAEAVGARVEWLVRIAVGPVALGELPPGAAREATASELGMLLAATGLD